jgi:putative ABC transport system ATP-binding protein
VLEADSLYRFFHAGDEETLALRGVSMTVVPGETVAITGPSGSGKSTLLACLAGLDEPDGGMVRINGQALSRRPEQERSRLRRQKVGVLFQYDNLWDHLTVAANVMTVQRLDHRADAGRTAALLDELGIFHRAGAYPSELSGGESARAGLAVALANDPAVILADEPTGELDSITAERVMDLLAERAVRGAAVVIVTHTPAVAARADRQIRLRDGVVAS